MTRATIFWPILGQVLLTFVVWVALYRSRVGEMRARRIRPQALATSRSAATTLENIAAADNFRNLFEMPVLFYAVCLALAVMDFVTPPQIALAWLFVALRAAHSLIHITYNRVMHRFAVYVASSVCVFAMWALFGFALLRAG